MPNTPSNARVANSVLEVIGGTPLVRLNRIAEPDAAQLLVKLESSNPGGSVKDNNKRS